jgi:hypothetical protein
MVHNNFKVSLQNLYETYLIAAAKFHCFIKTTKYEALMTPASLYCKKWFFLIHYIAAIFHCFSIAWYSIYLLDFIREFIDLSYYVLRSCIRSFHTDRTARFNATREDVTWLGYHAFIRILYKKQTAYLQLLHLLRRALGALGVAKHQILPVVHDPDQNYNLFIHQLHY